MELPYHHGFTIQEKTGWIFDELTGKNRMGF
jgi:hypothetical protein